ncbi:shikimate dehydrogenase [Caballeronia sp. LjRoot34]|jgi:shikimate dehydrogenase|uniref:shikimate dehydrogenase family protein n=1 Tax=Caballeronia sp. LjRoot34 TaxID=3342325 RepID=UPI003ECD464C
MTRIDGETQVVAILGDPIAQAKSPELFNALFARHGINAVLVPFHVAPEWLGSVLDGISGIRNLAGVVVTVPHKVAALVFAARLAGPALQTGAVNCLRREMNGEWTGSMFDGTGFVQGLRSQGCEPYGKRVLLAGAGGAGTAVGHALVEAGIASLDIFDMNTASAARLIDALRLRRTGAVIGEGCANARALHDLIINATSCGMRMDDPLPVDLSAANNHAVVADLIMKPAETRLLGEAKARGLITHPGRHLLEHSIEAIAGFLNLLSALEVRENPL